MRSNNTLLAVYIPCKNKKEAKDIALVLLQKKLIACGNIVPATSIYLWQGKLETPAEYVLLAKTTEKKYPAIEKTVSQLHSYTCPCIAAWKMDKVNVSYFNWVKEMVGE